MLPLAAICPIAMMTFTSPDLGAVQQRYEDHLHYELRAEGTISRELAASWQTPEVAGRRYILLGPASGEKIYLRAIEGPKTPPEPPELIVNEVVRILNSPTASSTLMVRSSGDLSAVSRTP